MRFASSWSPPDMGLIPPAALSADAHLAVKVARASVRRNEPSTIGSYETAARSWACFCENRDLPPFPVDPFTFSMYLHFKSSTISMNSLLGVYTAGVRDACNNNAGLPLAVQRRPDGHTNDSLSPEEVWTQRGKGEGPSYGHVSPGDGQATTRVAEPCRPVTRRSPLPTGGVHGDFRFLTRGGIYDLSEVFQSCPSWLAGTPARGV